MTGKVFGWALVLLLALYQGSLSFYFSFWFYSFNAVSYGPIAMTFVHWFW